MCSLVHTQNNKNNKKNILCMQSLKKKKRVLVYGATIDYLEVEVQNLMFFSDK